jgi:hypothetical protein
MAKQLSPRELEGEVRRLLQDATEDGVLLTRVQELARAEPAFGGLTPLWGPTLYGRNRAVFQPFILSHFAEFGFDPTRKGWKSFQRVEWKDHRKALDAWLEEVDRRDEVDLFVRLFGWKNRATIMDRKQKVVFNELKRRLESASTDAARLLVLRKMDLYCPLDEDDALEIYRLAPKLSSEYILRHLYQKWSWLAREEKRTLWSRMIDLAERHGDERLKKSVYRRTVTVEQWGRDAGDLCRRTQDADAPAAALQTIQPEGWLDLSPVFHGLAVEFGRRVVSYLLRNLDKLRRGWGDSAGYKPLLKLAHERDWMDLWVGILRVCANHDEYNKEIADWLKKDRVGGDELRRRLTMLCGVSREWNFSGFSLASVHALNDENALLLYERFPDLVRGPYRLHLQSTYTTAYEKLVERLLANGEEELIDFLASRFAVRTWSKPALKTAHTLSEHYLKLREESPEFTRRAAHVLGMVPAFSIWNNWAYKRLIEENRLARLLFERSASFYLGDAGAMQDLVEAPEIHVQMLAYRALGLDDERARACAAENIDILLGTLLRPLHRRTRLAAFGALANAATTPENAARILLRARDALELPDKRYPKEQLVELIARLLHRQPELRDAEEQPVVYGAIA